MSRPALSATRCIEILDFLASFPDRDFTLSEIARAAKINVASAHAVLAILVERGYLTRDPKLKTYVLGPGLVILGKAATERQTLFARAQTGAEELHHEIGVPLALKALIGNEIVTVSAIGAPGGNKRGARPGERLPLVPPIGAPFVAWASEAAVEAWIHGSPEGTPGLSDHWRRALALVKRRGFQMLLRSPDTSDLPLRMAQMAAGQNVPEYKDDLLKLINITGPSLAAEPDNILPDGLYDFHQLAAPIFDRDGVATLELCLGGFPGPLTGTKVQFYADVLMRTCLRIMEGDRARPAADQQRRDSPAALRRIGDERARASRVKDEAA